MSFPTVVASGTLHGMGTKETSELLHVLDALTRPPDGANPNDDPVWLDALSQTRDLDAQPKLAWIPRVLGGATRLQGDPGFAWWVYVNQLTRGVLDEVVAFATKDALLSLAAERADANYVAAESNLHSVYERAGYDDWFWSVVASCGEYSSDVLDGRSRFVVFAFLVARNVGQKPMRSARCLAATWRMFNASIETTSIRRAMGMRGNGRALVTKEAAERVVLLALGLALCAGLAVFAGVDW